MRYTPAMHLTFNPLCRLIGHRWRYTLTTVEGNKRYRCTRCGKIYLAPMR